MKKKELIAYLQEFGNDDTEVYIQKDCACGRSHEFIDIKTFFFHLGGACDVNGQLVGEHVITIETKRIGK